MDGAESPIAYPPPDIEVLLLVLEIEEEEEGMGPGTVWGSMWWWCCCCGLLLGIGCPDEADEVGGGGGEMT